MLASGILACNSTMTPFALYGNPRRAFRLAQPMSSIHYITCTLCKKLYIGETGRRIGDRFREHLRDVQKDDKNASKPVVRHFSRPNHSMQHMAVCGLSLHQGHTESRKTLKNIYIFLNRHS